MRGQVLRRVWAAGVAFSAVVASSAAMAQQPHTPNPALRERPSQEATQQAGAIVPAGKLKLDVVATGADGQPVRGLEPWDFSVLDNGKPRKVRTFRAYGGAIMPDPPVEVILLIDMVNVPFQQVAIVRDQLSKFLRADGGHLKQPVKLAVLQENGLQIQSRSSKDGNAQAAALGRMKEHISSFNAAMGGDGMVQRFQLAMRELEGLAENETHKPGRKLLIWTGPGWPMLVHPSDVQQDRDQRLFFRAIVQLSTWLREARVVLYSVAPMAWSGVGEFLSPTYYEGFLKGVSSPGQADSGNLALRVLVTQTGGLALGPGNDLAEQIDRCMDDANSFYRISIDPPRAEHADEYHLLRVTVDRPGVAVRTSTGYYDQPDQQ